VHRPAVLLTGASGYLGHHLGAALGARGLAWLAAGRGAAGLALDLERPETIEAALRAARPDRVLHAAAFASLPACEAEPARAAAVNTQATERLAQAARGRLLFVSTDLVFDGTRAPYRPGDPPTPLGVYARSKAAAEAAVRAAGGLVVRVPLLFGPSHDGRRGATDAIRAAAGPVPLFTNEFRTPLHVADAARGLVECLLEGAGAGIVHLAGPERVSRYELGRRFLAAARLSQVVLEPVVCRDALRPHDVALASDWSCGRSLDAALARS
jgi:dTDP-4-dehydrorhamnose reductase